MSLRSLRIGTFVAPNAAQEHPENRYHPIATATLNTPVFDVVHMFSERAISAVPIINEEGIVVNLYETVDVIVRPFQHLPLYISDFLYLQDPCPFRSISITRLEDIGGT